MKRLWANRLCIQHHATPLRCNGFNNSFAVSFQSFCPSFFFFLLSFYFVFVSFLFFLVGLEYYTLKSLEHFSFNSVRWGGSWYFRPSSRGGLANFTPIAGMGHLISGPKFKIPTSPPPLLISDKSLNLVVLVPWLHLQFANLLEKQTSKKIYFFINPWKHCHFAKL